jgi:flagellar biosynthetic protein FliP
MTKKTRHKMRLILLILGIFLFIEPATAQTLSLDMGQSSGQATSRVLQLLALMTVLSLAPSILMMVTSFTRLIIVFSFLRTALGLQQTPPNSVLISLALFLTMFIMEPTFTKSYNDGIKPLIENKLTEEQAIQPIVAPFHAFMMNNVRDKDLSLFFDISNTKAPEKLEETPLRLLVPAFMISELRRAFEIGFLLFIPFLIIDMMVSSTLMAMGMMMLPPVLVSLPFKLIFFVLIDGWHLVVGSLVKSFAV